MDERPHDPRAPDPLDPASPHLGGYGPIGRGWMPSAGHASAPFWRWRSLAHLGIGLAMLLVLLRPAEIEKPRPDRGVSNAYSALLSLARAQQVFRDEDRDGDGVANYAPDLSALIEAELFHPAHLGSDEQRYRLEPGPPDLTRQTWSASATAYVDGRGSFTYLIDERGMIRVADDVEPTGRPAD